tara:strand:+ start:14342 stop:15472 length:1131 start_codon:yes stop_codon:yes gene_type:complete
MSRFGKIKFLQSLVQGFKTSRKIVVIESDDWGSERIPNKEVREKLEKAGIDVTTNPHSKFDSLERLEDLEKLDELLTELEYKYHKKIRITANFIMGNPDFQKIKDSNFQEYHVELFTETYKKRDGDEKVIEKIKELLKKGYFQAQFHGREHINAQFWLQALQNKNTYFLDAFRLGCFAIDAPSNGNHRKNLMAAFEYENVSQKKYIEESITEGMQLFKKTFGFSSSTLISPRYIWHSDLEEKFAELGVKQLQTTFFQQEPTEGGYKNLYHYTGQKDKKTGLRYLVRNTFFEPSYSDDLDWSNHAFKKVKLAFRFNTPAIVSMHRLNFVGGLDTQTRDKNIFQFEKLIVKLIETYPDIEFLSSDELGDLIESKYVRN